MTGGVAWIVAGVAGAGKSTLGRALAARIGAPLLDLDVATNAILDALGPALWPDGHWNDRAHRNLVRPARYAVLRDLALDQESADLVLVAPFTLELAGGDPWAALVAAVSPRAPRVAWLAADPAVLAARRVARGEARDALAPPHTLDQPTPAVAHHRIDATRPTAEQVADLLA